METELSYVRQSLRGETIEQCKREEGQRGRAMRGATRTHVHRFVPQTHFLLGLKLQEQRAQTWGLETREHSLERQQAVIIGREVALPGK